MDSKTMSALWTRSFSAETLSSKSPGDTFGGPENSADDTLPLDSPEAPAPSSGYAFLEELGRGGMGIVYRARQQSLGREVAVKTAAPDQRALFEREARLTGGLEHPNIIPVHELGEKPGRGPIMAMKLVSGEPWSTALARDRDAGRLPAETLPRHLRILLSVSNALEYAHSRGVLHLDLKPDNVMLGPYGEVLLVDWGVALPFGEAAAVKAPRGTPRYMAPEMARGEALDARSDVYLLGASLYELLEGRPPHQGPDLWSVLQAAAENEPALADGHPDELTELVALCRKALALDPAERFGSVTALRKALEGFLAHRESLLVSARAQRELERCRAAEPGPDDEARAALYADFAQAIAGFAQARNLWAENPRARSGEARARLAFAELALAQGDLGLAHAQSERLEEGADRDQLSGAIAEQRLRLRRAESQRRQLKLGLLTSGAVLALSLISGLAYYIRANRIMTEQRDALAEEQKRTTAARARAELEKGRALRREAIVKETLARLVERVSRSLSALPGSSARAARKESLDAAVDGYEQLRSTLAAEDPEDPALADALCQIGRIRMEQLDAEAARSAYQAALDFLEPRPETPRKLGLVLIALEGLGDLALRTGSNEALGLRRRSYAVARAWREAAPESQDALRAFGLSALRLGGELSRNGEDLAAAEELLSEAAVIFRSLRRRLPELSQPGLDLAAALNLLIGIQLDRGAPQRAKQNAAELAPILNAFPNSTSARRLEVTALQSLNRLALLEKADEKLILARQSRALELCRQSVDADPSDQGARYLLADTLRSSANLFDELGHPDEAVLARARALEAFRGFTSAQYSNTNIPEALADLAIRCARDLEGQGRGSETQALLEEAIAARRDLAERSPKNPQAALELADACYRAGKALLLKDPDKSAERYRDAVAALRPHLDQPGAGVDLREKAALIFTWMAESLRRAGSITEGFAYARRAAAALGEPQRPKGRLLLGQLALGLGLLHQARNENEQAEAELARAEAIAKALKAGPLSEEARALAQLIAGARQSPDPLASLRATIDEARRRAAEQPSSENSIRLAAALRKLAAALRRRKQRAPARAAAEEALSLFQGLRDRGERDPRIGRFLPRCLIDVAEHRLQLGEAEQALALTEQAAVLAREQRSRKGQDPATRETLVATLTLLGFLERRRGEGDRAIALFEEAIAAAEAEPPLPPQRLSGLRYRLGRALCEDGQGLRGAAAIAASFRDKARARDPSATPAGLDQRALGDALAICKKARRHDAAIAIAFHLLAIRAREAEAAPSDAELGLAVFRLHLTLAELFDGAERYDDARLAVKSAEKELAALELRVPKLRDRIFLRSIVPTYLGRLDRLAGSPDSAIERYKEALALRRAFQKERPRSLDARRGLALLLFDLGEACEEARRLQEARGHFRACDEALKGVRELAPANDSLLADLNRRLASKPR